MNYAQVRDLTLKLLNQYTMAGTEVAPSYNCQQDYLNSIPGLANDAVMEIATSAFKIPTTFRLGAGPAVELEKEVRYELPGDFYQLVSGSIVKTTEGKYLHTNLYKLNGRKYLIVPKEEAGDYTLTYYRYPKLLSDRPKDTDELDNEEITHRAIPYYVASQLVAHEDMALCALWNNKYEDRLARMSEGVTAEIHPVSDVYSFEI